MTKVALIRYRLVETIPRAIDDGVLYVSREYGTAVHKCCCGCGNEVVTPLGPTDWTFDIDDDAVSVYPSIGNWGLPCRSHYWIDHGHIHWAEQWSDARIAQGRLRDRTAKQKYYGEEIHTDRRDWLARAWTWLRRLITSR